MRHGLAFSDGLGSSTLARFKRFDPLAFAVEPGTIVRFDACYGLEEAEFITVGPSLDRASHVR
jgi:hypothetical protein